jgi:dihydroorotase
MPNLKPAPDNREHLNQQLEIIAKDARVRVFPYGTITVGEKGKELADMEGMAEKVVAFSDDGRGVQNELMMKKAMETAVKLDKLIAAHCEDEQLLHGGYIHDGVYAMTHGHQGISSESEWGQIARDLELVRKTGCAYHVCHISTKESVELMRKAKSEGLDVSCETAPHYLVLCDEDLKDDGRFKMNPPIRDKADREALLKGLKDGTIDMIATDHAPHSEEEKSKGLKGSMMGIVGLETAFPILYTKLVKAGLCTLEQLVQWFHTNPAKRFKIGTPLEVGQPADLTIYDLERAYDINPAEFKSKGRSTPFAGEHVWGFCKLTMVNGTIVWEE